MIWRSLDRPVLATVATCCLMAATGCSGGGFSSAATNDLSPAARIAQAKQGTSPDAKSEPVGAPRETLWSRLTGLGGRSRDGLQNPVQVHLSYARLQEQWGNLVEARKSYETALGREPGSVEAMVGLARMDQLAGRTLEAEQGMVAALRIDPRSPIANHALGRLYADQKDWIRAIPLLKAATMASPNDTAIRYDLAVAMARSGDLNGAMPHFVQTTGEAEAHYNIGYILFEQGKHAEAEQRFTQALVLEPGLQQADAMLRRLQQDGQSGHQLASATRDAGRPPVTPNQQAEFQQPAAAPGYPRENVPQSRPPVFEAPETPVASWDPATGRRRVSQTDYHPHSGQHVQPAGGHSASANGAIGREVTVPRWPNTGAAGSYPPAESRSQTDGMTPAQREQWENQSAGQAR